MESLKILISAYACSPFKGSEPGVGWNFIKNLSKYHELHVITEELEFKEDINKFMQENPDFKNVKFYYISRQIEYFSKVFPPLFYYFYNNWQKKAYKLALELEKKENYDIIHQLNFVGYREPGYLWKINKPFVWGPIGGMENTAFKLLLNLDLTNFIYYFLRNVLNRLQIVFLLRPQKAARRKNNFLIAATPKNQAVILKYWRRNCLIIPEVGQEERMEITIKNRMPEETFRIVWSGQHTGGKALNILLKSLVKLPPEMNWTLIVLGDGKKTRSWKKLSEKLGVENKIQWKGWLPRVEAHEIMLSAHLMCITSLKDLTSTVILEALSFGLPVICIDHCGFSHVINDHCGIKIPILTPQHLTSAFAKAIANLYFDEDFRKKLAEGATQRAREFSWAGNTQALNQVYRSLIVL